MINCCTAASEEKRLNWTEHFNAADACMLCWQRYDQKTDTYLSLERNFTRKLSAESVLTKGINIFIEFFVCESCLHHASKSVCKRGHLHSALEPPLTVTQVPVISLEAQSARNKLLLEQLGL